MSVLPPFLFRVASDNSRGFNSAEKIDPLFGYNSQYHQNLGSIPYDTARNMIYDHVEYHYYAASEFSSWSISLLFVLQFAIRKFFALREGKVLIYVLNTARLAASNGAYSATELVKEYKLENFKNLRDFTTHEYLIHGKLEHTEGLWKAVYFGRLISAGFLNSFTAMKDESRQELLYVRVLELRYGWFQNDQWLTPETYAALHKLGACFGEDFEGVVTIALIALRQRDKSPDSIHNLLAELESTSVSVPELDWQSNLHLRMFKIKWIDMYESRQFMQLLQLLHERQIADLPYSHRVSIHSAIEPSVASTPVKSLPSTYSRPSNGMTEQREENDSTRNDIGLSELASSTQNSHLPITVAEDSETESEVIVDESPPPRKRRTVDVLG